MAIYSDLPVYKASYGLLVNIFDLSRQFPREYKYTIGEKLKNEAIDMITNIYRANSREEKKELLQRARENVEAIRLYLRLLRDLRQLSIPKFVEVSERVENISKQLAGWHKSVQ